MRTYLKFDKRYQGRRKYAKGNYDRLPLVAAGETLIAESRFNKVTKGKPSELIERLGVPAVARGPSQ